MCGCAAFKNLLLLLLLLLLRVKELLPPHVMKLGVFVKQPALLQRVHCKTHFSNQGVRGQGGAMKGTIDSQDANSKKHLGAESTAGTSSTLYCTCWGCAAAPVPGVVTRGITAGGIVL